MRSKPHIWAILVTLLATGSLTFAGTCSTGCLDLFGFQEGGQKWVWTSSTPETGYSREGYGESPLAGYDTALTCKKKPADVDGENPCTSLCSSCTTMNEPCMLDHCVAGNGNEVSYSCYLACTDE